MEGADRGRDLGHTCIAKRQESKKWLLSKIVSGHP